MTTSIACTNLEFHVSVAISGVINAAIASVRADSETVQLFPAAFAEVDAEAVRVYNAASSAAYAALDVLRDEIAALRRSIARSLDSRNSARVAKSAIRRCLDSDIPPGTRASIALSDAI